MIIENDIIHQVKININKGNIEGLKELWEEIQNTDFERELAWDYIFQKIYIHSALKKQHEICKWLEKLYENLDPIQKIAIKHTFSYGKYLLNK